VVERAIKCTWNHREEGKEIYGVFRVDGAVLRGKWRCGNDVGRNEEGKENCSYSHFRPHLG